MKVLFVNSCLRKQSRTKMLANAYLEKLQQAEENVEITEIELQKMALQPLNAELLAKRDELSAAADFNNEFFAVAREFAAADKIVIAAPYYDFQFPAILKTYLENICVCGIAFKYSEHGAPIGLCKATELVYITTAGGYIAEYNCGYDYVKALCVLLGIENTKCFTAECLDIDGCDIEYIMTRAASKITI